MTSIIWFMMAAPVLLFVAVAFAKSENKTIELASGLHALVEPIVQGLATIAGLSAVASLLLPKLLYRPKSATSLDQALSDLQKIKSEDNSPVYSSVQLQAFKTCDFRHVHLLVLFPQWMTSWLIGLVFAEAVATLGLGASFLSHSFSTMIPFAAGSLVLLISKKPSLDKFIATSMV